MKFVEDRPGHDFRYAINPIRIKKELGWEVKHPYKKSLESTVIWYLENQEWCKNILKKSGYNGERLGLINLK